MRTKSDSGSFYQLFITDSMRGNLKIHWRQPLYSESSCSQCIGYIAVECCSNLAAASGYELWCLLLFHASQAVTAENRYTKSSAFTNIMQNYISDVSYSYTCKNALYASHNYNASIFRRRSGRDDGIGNRERLAGLLLFNDPTHRLGPTRFYPQNRFIMC